MTLLEPLFWLHHGVSTLRFALSSTLIIDKMIDKIWADWQSKHEQNANAFVAGTVSPLTNLTFYNEWPTGAPPMLQVCESRLSLTQV